MPALISPPDMGGAPFLTFLTLHWTLQYLLLVLKSPEPDTVLQMRLQQCWIEEKDLLSWPAGNHCIMQARIPSTLSASACHRLIFSLVPTGTCSSFCAKLLSSVTAPSTYCCMGFFLPSCRTLHFFSNSTRFLSAHLPSLHMCIRVRY